MSLNDSLHMAVSNGLSGRMAHVSPASAFEAVEWSSVHEKPAGATHSVWELLHHLIYWQEYCLCLLEGGKPTPPEHASESWIIPPAPRDEATWNAAVARFLQGLERALRESTTGRLDEPIAAKPQESRMEVVTSLIGHNSYHLGQVVLLRQMQGSWPPPSGGNTW